MNGSAIHDEWVSLLDVSGPFLAGPVLKEAFPQGLEGLDPVVKKEVRQAYDEWREAVDFGEADLPKLHGAWISFVLHRVLGFDADHALVADATADRFRYAVPESGIAISPDIVLSDGRADGRVFLLVKKYEARVALDEAGSPDGWAANPIERMTELCRATGVRLGLVTNGERWTLVDAPVGAVVSTASWYARLPIDNRTVLLLLEAVQLFQGRTLSYLALDVEQIGYVYEGLLERTVVRAEGPTLDLRATKSALHPWVKLSELDDAAAEGASAVEELLKERTGSSASRIRHDLAKKLDETESGKLLAACHGDVGLRDRVKPYFHLLRTDSWGYPLVYPKGTFMVASGSDRRETGTHYTPKSFTEAIVKTTLEPLVYVGPPEGLPRDQWRLKSPQELLDLRICDPAMGSGAFLVQVCRYLGERVVEAWGEAEKAGKKVSADGDVKDEIDVAGPISSNIEERSLVARRLVAEHCLYGLDMNPLAVELAKLSIWLVTLAKGRPFGFLDHNLRSGDSLLGITSLAQAHHLQMKPHEGSAKKLFAAELDRALAKAIDLRRELRARVIRDISDVRAMEELESQARSKLSLPILVSDAVVGSYLANEGDFSDYSAMLAVSIGEILQGKFSSLAKLEADTRRDLNVGLPDGKPRRRPFHWPLEFPEVFDGNRAGFDAFVGNPPFLGGRRISTALGKAYERYLKACLTAKKGSADLCAYFFLRVNSLCRKEGCFGLLATNTIAQTETRAIGLETIIAETALYFAVPSVPWPGSAAVSVAIVNGYKGTWSGTRWLSGKQVAHISASLSDAQVSISARPLAETKARYFGTKGTYVHGTGFVLSETVALRFISDDAANADVIKPYLVAKDFTTNPDQRPSRWVIDFGTREEEEAKHYAGPFLHIERTVRPQREKLVGQIHEESFWKFWDKRAELYARIAELNKVIVCPEVSKYSVFALVENGCVFSHMVNVVASDSYGAFACLQSSVHGLWAWFQGSTMETRLRYTTSDCLDTFPFPESVEGLARIGEQFHRERSRLMRERGEGLTKIYNRIHDKGCEDAEIKTLRSMICAADAAVFAVYGWHDFAEVPSHRETALGLRYTYSKTLADEIINRLLLLNAERYCAESRGTKHHTRKPGHHRELPLLNRQDMP